MLETLDQNQIFNLLVTLAIAASVAGFMAGLLGVGGGLIIVPALYYAFTVLDFELLTRMHLSLGTSLAIIIPTSIISTKTHMEYDAVDFKLIKSFGIFVLLGVILGTSLATNLKTPNLILFFSIFAFIVGLFFIFLREKIGEKPRNISNNIKSIMGTIIGFISVPLGIGGGSLTVPFMKMFGYNIRTAIGTAAAIGFLIAVSGAITMSISGFFFGNVTTPWSLGYVNFLGFLVFVPVTMIMARIGAKVVYKIDKKLLSKIFGIFLLIISIRSFIEYLSIN